jgi:predicted amidophosphoribosyltransferase
VDTSRTGVGRHLSQLAGEPHHERMLPAWLGDIADLVLARTCIACARPGRSLCDSCFSGMRSSAREVHPFTSVPRVALSAGVAYEGPGKALVLGHKRDLIRALAEPAGVLLADAVRVHSPTPMAVQLVPIPSHRAARRTRGQDTVAVLARIAAQSLHADGYRASVAALLDWTEHRPSLAGHSAKERHALIDGAFRVRGAGSIGSMCVVVDDVITTGATVGTAADALMSAGFRVLGCSAVAGTFR